MTKPNSSCEIEMPASLRSEVFGFIPECRSASLRNQRPASKESSLRVRKHAIRDGSGLFRKVNLAQQLYHERAIPRLHGGVPFGEKSGHEETFIGGHTAVVGHVATFWP